MNRRYFIQTLFAASLWNKSILGSTKMNSSSELHVISNKPHLIIPVLLEELKKLGIRQGNTFAFSNSSFFEKQMIRSLQKTGWSYSPFQKHAHLLFSFRTLKHKIRPSFTLARKGQVWDIRSKRLFSLWKEVNQSHALSSSLTIASFRGSAQNFSGKTISVFCQGKKMDSLFLAGNKTKTYKSHSGTITLTVNNGKAWVKESSCRHQICCLTPPVSLAGERIICAPNHFLAEVDRTSRIDTSIG